MSSPSIRHITNIDLTRWHARLHKRGYRSGLHPGEILDLCLASARRESTVLRAMLTSVRTTVLTELALDPDLLAHDIASEGNRHPLSLLHPEQMLGFESNILAFAAVLVTQRRPPPWLLRETYLGRKVRGLVLELRDPGPAGLAWRIHEAATPALLAARGELDEAIESDRWPSRAGCAALSEVLEIIERSPELPPKLRANLVISKGIFHQLEGGVTNLFVNFMFSSLDQAESWCRTRKPYCRGPMQQLAEDLAAPTLRMAGFITPSRARSNRRPLHVARRNVSFDRGGSRRSSDVTNDDMIARLREFAGYVQDCCGNDNELFTEGYMSDLSEENIS